MDEKSLEILGFNEIKQKLAEYTSFSAGRELVLTLMPVSDDNQVTLRLKQSEEGRRLLFQEAGFSIDGASDIREIVGMAALGKIIEPMKLIEIQQTLAIMRRVCTNLQTRSNELPSLWEISKELTEFPDLEKDISRCISPNGDVLDSASKELALTRKRLGEVRQTLRGRLEEIIRTPGGQRVVQESLITEREGRYVIPVKAEARREIEGITHDVSNTGSTLFIEPVVTIEMGNTVRELASEEKREVERILRNLSIAVGACATEIAINVSRLAELDLVLAKAKYAREVKACEPYISKDASQVCIELIDARHPLLGIKAIPLSIKIGEDFSTLVITGPNTGGKTVALKTIGLLSLMTQSGIPIPAAPETSLPLFDEVFADIGDEQSIEQTLSSFSWHMKNVVRILENATGKSLVLLDELGTSTDPAEGSALARSILLHLLSSGILTVATTHYSDLKAFAHNTEGMQNASFDFNPDTLAPTYHLTLGIPGGSNALVTAERLGVSPAIIGEARTMLSKGALDLDAAIADIMTENKRVKEVREHLETEKSDTEEQKKELETRLTRLRDTEQQIIQEARDRVIRESAELQRQIRQVNSELRKQKRRETVELARQTLADTRNRLDREEWSPKTPKNESIAIVVGDTVYLKETNMKAIVLSISEKTGEAELQAGQIKIKVKIDNLEKAPTGIKPIAGSVGKIVMASQRISQPELDLRGKHADEVEVALDNYLNNAALSNLNEIVIIHGIATGTVRQITRDFLSTHPLVRSFRSGGQGEGGGGVTVVSL